MGGNCLIVTLLAFIVGAGRAEWPASGDRAGFPLTPSFALDLTASTGSRNIAPVAFDGTTFLCADENSGTVYRLNKAGQFINQLTIPGVTGITGLTYDGQHFWVAHNSPDLIRIDIDGRRVIRHLTSPVPAHHLAFNADKGALFVGGTSGDIMLIDTLVGAIFDTLPAGRHKITGISGTAYDNVTTGGPYLWVASRNGSTSAAGLHVLRLPDGFPAADPHDIMEDIGIPNGAQTGAAGGLFVIAESTSGTVTVGGVLQSFPSNLLFGYAAGNPSPIDAELVSAEFPSEYSRIPLSQIIPLRLRATIRNDGIMSLSDVGLGVDILRNGMVLHSLRSETVATLLPARVDTFGLEEFTPESVGTYLFRYYTVMRDSDLNPANDTLSHTVLVTDSTLARDIGAVQRAYSISNTDSAEGGAVFTLVHPALLQSVSLFFVQPEPDFRSAAVIRRFDGLPGDVLARSIPLPITGRDSVWVTVPLDGGPVPLPPGPFFVGVTEGNGLLGLGNTENINTPGANFFRMGMSDWRRSGIQGARMIRVQMLPPVTTFRNAPGDIGPEYSFPDIAPNPFNPSTNIRYTLPVLSYVHLTVTSILGEQIAELVHGIQEAGSHRIPFDAGRFASGVYFATLDCRAVGGGQQYQSTRKMLLLR
jgi:hypothetical protein